MHKFANKNNNSCPKDFPANKPKSRNGLFSKTGLLNLCLVFTISFSTAIDVSANQLDQLKRIHDRLAGVPPTPEDMKKMLDASDLTAAANIAMQNPNFYNVTLKNFATPWTNEAQSVFEPLNDYSATVIGMIRDDLDFRQMLYENIIYTYNGAVTPYSNTNNQHYIDLENNNIDLSDKINFTAKLQSAVTGLPPEATAGVMTSRAASRAFFVDGTNRAMFRFTLLNHLCYDMEQIKDNTRPADRIRQDVSRSPGGDSRIYFTNCLACHAGMDPMVQAFANYEWAYKDINPDNPDVGRLEYTPGVVQPKYHINATNFRGGYVTPDDRWTNYWRRGPNAWLGWENNDIPAVKSGKGAKSLGEELAHTDAFARCQVKKVFKAVCLRAPDSSDAEFDNMVNVFKTENYNMKKAFARAAVYCSGD